MKKTSLIQNTLGCIKTQVFNAMSLRSKKRISRKKPHKQDLTDNEKERNRRMSKIRIRVEHVISEIKRSRTAKDVLRNTKDGFSDLVMVIACGLHNLRIDRRKLPLNL